jgi:hypothetical protein
MGRRFGGDHTIEVITVSQATWWDVNGRICNRDVLSCQLTASGSCCVIIGVSWSYGSKFKGIEGIRICK